MILTCAPFHHFPLPHHSAFKHSCYFYSLNVGRELSVTSERFPSLWSLTSSATDSRIDSPPFNCENTCIIVLSHPIWSQIEEMLLVLERGNGNGIMMINYTHILVLITRIRSFLWEETCCYSGRFIKVRIIRASFHKWKAAALI